MIIKTDKDDLIQAEMEQYHKYLEPKESLLITTPMGTKIHVGPWGEITVVHGRKKIDVFTPDWGPDGLPIFVDGEFTRGSP